MRSRKILVIGAVGVHGVILHLDLLPFYSCRLPNPRPGCRTDAEIVQTVVSLGFNWAVEAFNPFSRLLQVVLRFL